MENVLESRDRIHEWMKLQEWDQVQEAWLEILETAPQPVEFHEPLVTRLVRRKFQDWMENLYGLLLDELVNREKYDEAVELIRLILRWQHDAAFVLEPLRKALLGIHAMRPAERIRHFFELAGLDKPAPRIARSLQKFEELVGVSKGHVYRHSRWGLGLVVDLDAENGKVTIDFAGKKGQTFTVEGVKEFLQHVPQDHFVAAMVSDPEALRRRVQDTPAEAVKFALRSYGGRVAVADLKKLFLEGLMDEAGWKKWWETARAALRVDPWVDMEGAGARIELCLRTEPRSFADEILERLRAAKTVVEFRDCLRELRRHQDEAELSEAHHREIARLIRERLAANPPDAIAPRLGLGYLWNEYPEILNTALPETEWNEGELIGEARDAQVVADAVLAMKVYEQQIRACEGIRTLNPSRWPSVFILIAPLSPPRVVSWIEKQLADAHEEKARHACLDAVVSQPARNPDAFLWTVRQLLDEQWTDVAEGVSHASLFSDVLRLLDDQHHRVEKGGAGAVEAKALLSKLRTFVNDSNLRLWRKVAKSCTFDEAKRLLSQVHLNGGLSDMAKEGMEIVLISSHPDLKKQSRIEAEEEIKKPSFVYSTAAALEAQRTKLSHIMNVDIPENSKQIGIARGHGDLRENAEYHAAKERQKLLHQQAQELSDLIARVRVVEPEMVRTDAVGFGTRFKALDKSNQKTCEFTILGSWEADPDRNVLSYLTPLGGAFLSAKPGQTVEVVANDGQRHAYQILSIEKAL